MPQLEKRGVLRARAAALRQRAAWLADQFTMAATRAQVTTVVARLDAEIDRLQGDGNVEGLPRLPHFLPETTARLERLMDLLRTAGRHARPLPDAPRGLDDALPRASQTKRRPPARPPADKAN